MDWLNYHHLLYFWVTAKKGSIAEASKTLRLSQSTISEQIKSLENSINDKLFQKKGRKLSLTDAGRLAFEYSEQIFAMGNELKSALSEKTYSKLQHFVVGTTNSIPKLVAFRLIQPILELETQTSFTVVENTIEELSAMLLLNKVDIVISDQNVRSTPGLKLFNHSLGVSNINIYTHKNDPNNYLNDFPDCLNGAPVLLPTEGTSIRSQLDLWFYKNKISPFIMGEFDDSSLLKVFASNKKGLFFSPSVIDDEVTLKYNVKSITTLTDIVEEYYAITTEKKIRHIAAESILEHAREKLFNIS